MTMLNEYNEKMAAITEIISEEVKNSYPRAVEKVRALLHEPEPNNRKKGHSRMAKRKKGIGFTILLSLPPVPPALSIYDLAQEIYGDDCDKEAYHLTMTIKRLIEHGWMISCQKLGYYTLGREHRDLLLRYCRASRPKKGMIEYEPEWPYGIKLTPENVKTEIKINKAK